MTAIAPRPAMPALLDPAQILAELFRRQALLASLGLLFLAALVPTLMLASVDPRVLDGAEVWAKPAKFLGSLSMYCLTTAWYFGYVDPAVRRGRTGRLIARGVAVTSLLEIAYIIVQAARGERSHFNTHDLFHIVMYALMGLAAVALVSMSALLAGLIARRPAPDLRPAWRDAVVLGLLLTVALGGGLGGYMSAQSGHMIGAAAQSGLPLFGWSMTGGDLRPPHFFGIHAEQFLPFVALFIPGRGLASRLAVWLAALAYVAFTLAVFARALNGKPFLAT